MNPRIVLFSALVLLITACALSGTVGVEQHRWWSGLGPVLPHSTFPADCRLCHQGTGWNDLVPKFAFDHEAETGVRLEGAHEYAQCLRCHNDRGHVTTFQSKGCLGCHEDVHEGDLTAECTVCHTQDAWKPVRQYELHQTTRFPLTGVHAFTACNRCHDGAEVGNFLPADPECLTCHADDLARTVNHAALGWVDRCDRCHIPTFWNNAEVND